MRYAHLYCIRIGYLTSKLDATLSVSTTPLLRFISFVRPCYGPTRWTTGKTIFECLIFERVLVRVISGCSDVK